MSLWARPLDSRWVRLGLQVGAGAIVVALVIAGAWVWYSRQESRGQAAFAEAAQLVQQIATGQTPPETWDKATRALQAVIDHYPRLSSLPHAAYQLGNVRYAAGQYAQARSAYELALAKGATGVLRTLTALGIGYTWEAEKNYANAVTAYQAVLRGLGPKETLYEEGLLALARAQELAGKPAAAVETYERILKEMPESARGQELRVRIASLQSRAGR